MGSGDCHSLHYYFIKKKKTRKEKLYEIINASIWTSKSDVFFGLYSTYIDKKDDLAELEKIEKQLFRWSTCSTRSFTTSLPNYLLKRRIFKFTHKK